tara:strand:+ start:4108 stop:4368 length:261 start_codon:yes stop_codon:yes gene_type:complete
VLDLSIPNAHQRHILWQRFKTPEFQYDKEIDLEYLAEQHELTAASIFNILHYSILKCLTRNDKIIKLNDLQSGLKIEKIKEGKNMV